MEPQSYTELIQFLHPADTAVEVTTDPLPGCVYTGGSAALTSVHSSQPKGLLSLSEK